MSENVGPTILIKNAYIQKKIAELLLQWAKEFPHEVQAFGEHCQALRSDAEWKGQFSRVVYNSKARDMAWTIKIPSRLDGAMSLLFSPRWKEDQSKNSIFDEFCKQFKVGVIRGTPRPDVTRKLDIKI